MFLHWGPILKAAVCLNKAGAGFEAAGALVVVLADALLPCVPWVPPSARPADPSRSVCPGAVLPCGLAKQFWIPHRQGGWGKRWLFAL